MSTYDLLASMGPCLFRHGNHIHYHAGQVHLKLQWGRAFSGTEIQSTYWAANAGFIASMGPCLFRHGNNMSCITCGENNGASMGPCLFKHGNYMLMTVSHLDKMLQWGRAFSGTEILAYWEYFSSHIMLQWGRAFSGTEMDDSPTSLIAVTGFNGAVPFQARKSYSPAAITGRIRLQWGRAFSGTEINLWFSFQIFFLYASMGPCLFRHGNV